MRTDEIRKRVDDQDGDGRSGPGGLVATLLTPRAGASDARAPSDPEVVAKPKRRQFTAEYRLRILEEAERCTQPGEVGRLLRARGCTAPSDGLAQGAASGFASGPDPEQARSEARRAQPPPARRCTSSRRKWRGWRRSCTPPIRSWTSREKLPGCWDSASNTGRTADGCPTARIAGRRGAGVPSAGGAAGYLLPSPEARSRASAAPSCAPPGPCARPNARTSSTCSPARAFVDRSPAEGRRDAAR